MNEALKVTLVLKGLKVRRDHRVRKALRVITVQVYIPGLSTRMIRLAPV